MGVMECYTLISFDISSKLFVETIEACCEAGEVGRND